MPSNETTMHWRRVASGGSSGDREDSRNWLVNRFAPYLFAVAKKRFRVLHPSTPVEDLVQETWLRFFRKVASAEGGKWLEPKRDEWDAEKGTSYSAAVLAYLCAILRNVLKAAREREISINSREAGLPRSGDSSEPTGSQLARTTRGVITRLSESELLDRVHQQLEGLSPADSEILCQAYLEGSPYEVIAEQLGISEAAARKRAQLARGRFKARWNTDIYPED